MSENAVQRSIYPERVDRNGYGLGKAHVEVQMFHGPDSNEVWIYITKDVAHPIGGNPERSIVTLVLTRAEWDLIATLGTLGPIWLEEES